MPTKIRNTADVLEKLKRSQAFVDRMIPELLNRLTPEQTASIFTKTQPLVLFDLYDGPNKTVACEPYILDLSELPNMDKNFALMNTQLAAAGGVPVVLGWDWPAFKVAGLGLAFPAKDR